MTDILEQHLNENGIEVLTNAKIEAFTGNGKDRKSTRLNSSHLRESRMPSSA